MKQLQEFLEEAIFMKDFSHANILVTLGVCWRIGDRPNVVLPYMALGDLGSLLRKPEMVSDFDMTQVTLSCLFSYDSDYTFLSLKLGKSLIFCFLPFFSCSQTETSFISGCKWQREWSI